MRAHSRLSTEAPFWQVSVFGAAEGEGELMMTFGDVASPGGALPLRHPYDVLHAHGLLLVSEYDVSLR